MGTSPRVSSVYADPMLADPAVPSSSSKASVLIVDDEWDIREMMSLYLELCGYVVYGASDGAEAIAVAGRAQPDIILMDLMMPRMDGWEATRRLKANSSTSDIVVVAFSARSQSDGAQAARRAGCAAFISKPCNLARLDATLRQFIYRRLPPLRSSNN